jgi:hypothetical protein
LVQAEHWNLIRITQVNVVVGVGSGVKPANLAWAWMIGITGPAAAVPGAMSKTVLSAGETISIPAMGILVLGAGTPVPLVCLVTGGVPGRQLERLPFGGQAHLSIAFSLKRREAGVKVQECRSAEAPLHSTGPLPAPARQGLLYT